MRHTESDRRCGTEGSGLRDTVVLTKLILTQPIRLEHWNAHFSAVGCTRGQVAVHSRDVEVMTSRPRYYTRLGVLVYQRGKTDEGRRAWRENTRCYLSRNMLRLECELVQCVCAYSRYKFSCLAVIQCVCCFLKIASVCLWAKDLDKRSLQWWLLPLKLGVPIKNLGWELMGQSEYVCA